MFAWMGLTLFSLTHPVTISQVRYGLCILCGNHATALPERTLRESQLDMLILGEGELTLIDVLEKLRNGSKIKHIPGTAFLENGTFVQNKPRELIRDLDILPFPAYDLINIKNHFGSIRSHHVKNKKCLYLLISRGCPFDCVFCGSCGRANPL